MACDDGDGGARRCHRLKIICEAATYVAVADEMLGEYDDVCLNEQSGYRRGIICPHHHQNIANHGVLIPLSLVKVSVKRRYAIVKIFSDGLEAMSDIKNTSSDGDLRGLRGDINRYRGRHMLMMVSIICGRGCRPKRMRLRDLSRRLPYCMMSTL